MGRAYGPASLKSIKPKHIEADLAHLPDGKANTRLKAWRRVMGGAKGRGEIEIDPSQLVSARKIETEGHLPWTAGEIEAFRKRWPIGTTARAFELLSWTGAHMKDAVTLGPSNIDHDGHLVYRQTKVKKPARVPWSGALPSFARSWAAERESVKRALECLAGGFTFLETHGKVRSVKGLGNLL